MVFANISYISQLHIVNRQCKHAWNVTHPLFGLINELIAVKRRQFSPSFCDHRHSTWVLRKRITTKFWSPIGLYCVNCTRFGQLILRKIIKIFATRCHFFSLKCTKFNFGWGEERRGGKGREGSGMRPPQRFTEMSPLRHAACSLSTSGTGPSEFSLTIFIGSFPVICCIYYRVVFTCSTWPRHCWLMQHCLNAGYKRTRAHCTVKVHAVAW